MAAIEPISIRLNISDIQFTTGKVRRISYWIEYVNLSIFRPIVYQYHQTPYDPNWTIFVCISVCQCLMDALSVWFFNSVRSLFHFMTDFINIYRFHVSCSKPEAACGWQLFQNKFLHQMLYTLKLWM